MKPPIKLFFDECCSKRLARKIVEVYDEDYPGILTKHLTDDLKAGTPDDVWVQRLEDEQDWIVLTSDLGVDAKKPKLPILCQQFKITYLSMTPALKNAGYPAHKQAMLCVWPQIMRTPKLPRGTKVSFGLRPFPGRMWPFLTIESKSFDVWCDEKQIPAEITGQRPNDPPKKPPRKVGLDSN